VTIETVTTFTCDRCGEHTTEEGSLNWFELRLIRNLRREIIVDAHLCWKCKAAFDAFWKTTD